jgi:hypothetical protein
MMGAPLRDNAILNYCNQVSIMRGLQSMSNGNYGATLKHGTERGL